MKFLASENFVIYGILCMYTVHVHLRCGYNVQVYMYGLERERGERSREKKKVIT